MTWTHIRSGVWYIAELISDFLIVFDIIVAKQLPRNVISANIYDYMKLVNENVPIHICIEFGIY